MWCYLAIPIAVAPIVSTITPSDYETSEADIRQAARRILADPVFRGFEHFGEPTIGEPGTASDIPVDSAVEPRPESAETGPWWKDLRRPGTAPQKQQGTQGSQEQPSPGGDAPRGEKPADGSPAAQPGGQTTPEVTPGEKRAPDAERTDAAAGKPSGDVRPAEATPSAAPRPSSGSAERPQRVSASATPRGMPSLRGQDGVERPVRFAPKVREPYKPSSNERSWNFDLGLGNLFAGIGSLLGNLLHGLAYLALVVVGVLIVLLAGRAIVDLMRSRRGRVAMTSGSIVPLADDRSPGEVAADVYLQKALGLAQGGRYHEALGQLLLGAMSAIERQQWIRYRRGLTLHDYLRSLRSHPEQFEGFRTVVQTYEPVEYGRRLATETAFAAALEGYQQGFSRKRPTEPGG